MKSLMNIIKQIYPMNKNSVEEIKSIEGNKSIEEFLDNVEQIGTFLRTYEIKRIKGIVTLDKNIRYGKRVFEGYLEDIADYIDRETDRKIKGSISTYEWVRAIHQTTNEGKQENHVLRLIGMYWPNIQEEASQFPLGNIKYQIEMEGVD